MGARRWGLGPALAGIAVLSCLAPANAQPAPGALRPGMVVREAGLSLVAPPAGMTVWAEAVRPDGATAVVGVETRADGTAVIHRGAGASDRSGPSAGQVVLDPCADDANLTVGAAWSEPYRWRFKASTTPVGMSRTAVTAALKRAVNNITGADNDCDRSDNVAAQHTYLGGSTKSANIGSSSTCTPYDGVSVVSFGDLGGIDLAMTCWWTISGQTVEADLKLNKVDFRWVVSPGSACGYKFAVEAVATHEFGHAFGLDHVSEAQHGSLTMSPVIGPCQLSEATLGLGDLQGLEDLY